MSSTQLSGDGATESRGPAAVTLRFEVTALPVADDLDAARSDVAALAPLLHETADHHGSFEAVARAHDWWDWLVRRRRAQGLTTNRTRYRRLSGCDDCYI